jgi:hypothetical protein
MGFNLRLAEPKTVADTPVLHLDGFDTWEGVNHGQDMWF